MTITEARFLQTGIAFCLPTNIVKTLNGQSFKGCENGLTFCCIHVTGYVKLNAMTLMQIFDEGCRAFLRLPLSVTQLAH